MSAKPTVKAIREGFQTVTPYLVVREPDGLIEFVKTAFGAKETFRTAAGGGGTHAEVRIGNSMVMIGGGANVEPVPAMLHLYLENVDAVYKSAVAAGATSLEQPASQPYGDRRGGVKDKFGNSWYIAWPVKGISP